MNTRFDYMYRDASNYKKTAYVVFAGEISEEEKRKLAEHLDEGTYFIPEQVGLPNPRDEWWSHYDDDHVWNELDPENDIGLTDQPPSTEGRDVHAFVAEFLSVEWDVTAAVEQCLNPFVEATRQGS